MNTKQFEGHTPGEWEPVYVSKVCTGVGAVIPTEGYGYYHEIICNSILPNTDKEYEKQKTNILANMKLIAAAPALLSELELTRKVLEELVETSERVFRAQGPKPEENFIKIYWHELEESLTNARKLLQP